MAKFLLTVWPIAGHSYPNLAIARALRDRGHEVAFYTGSRIQGLVEGEGFGFFPFQRVDEGLVDRVFYSDPISAATLRQKLDQRKKYRDWLIGTLPEQVEDLQAILSRWKPDVLVCDPALWGPYLVLEEIHKIPVAIFAYIPACLLPGPDAPPPGLGLPPPRDWKRRVQATVGGAAIRLLTVDIRRSANAVRKQYGLEPLCMTVTELAGKMPLYLVAGTREFDYNRRDLPPSVHYIGPCLGYESTDGPPPAWLQELPRDKPWVHVTEGTVHVQKPLVLQAAARGLGDRAMQVIMATGTHRDPADLGLDPVASNITVQRWIPYADMLPHTDLVVTTGGAGTVLSSLIAGVPLVVIPTEWDKPENAQRVVEAGAGVRLSPRRCTPKRLREAVEMVLREPSFRRNAGRLAESFSRCGGPSEAAGLLERIIPSSARGA
jgi:MGT family glycosyltransferase